MASTGSLVLAVLATATASPWCTAGAAGIWRRRASDAHYVFENWATKSSTDRPASSGILVLAGNATAHEAALDCALRANLAPNSEAAARLADDASKHRIDCGGAGGCARLVDAAAEVLRRRASLWTVLLVERAELAPTAQLSNLVAKFVGKSTCRSRTAEATANPDCSRTLFVLSTSFGRAELLNPAWRAQPAEKLDAEVRKREAKWLLGAPEHHAQQVPQKLRDSLRVVLGDAPDDPFAALIATAEAERAAGGDCLATGDAFGRFVGQPEVVAEVRKAAAEEFSYSDEAHKFFFYGHPGTGKTYLSSLIATALHNSTEKPYFHAVFGAGLTQEGDIDRLTGAACHLRSGGETVLEELYANERRPVLVFDEIEKAHEKLMTSLLQAADTKGKWQYQVLDRATDGCPWRERETAGSYLVLTSNCYMRELREEEARAAGEADPRRRYELIRSRMEARIFDDRIPCSDAAGDRNPFQRVEMADRFRGRLFPFLPLTPDETAAGLRVTMDEVRRRSAAKHNVSLYWTDGYLGWWARQGTIREVTGRITTGSVRRLDWAPTTVVDLQQAESRRCAADGRGPLRKLVLTIEDGRPASRGYCAPPEEAAAAGAAAGGGASGGGGEQAFAAGGGGGDGGATAAATATAATITAPSQTYSRSASQSAA